ncbi:MAG: DEAD/DEAH box helicase family protein [Planctomycetes bacterium]|nr:DEAD/DEAH box helicase family protein [Planctomycetota bacterium]
MNITLPSLYAHQEDLLDRTRAALAQRRRVILCAGCGVGKTRIAKWILGASANRQPGERASGKSLFVVQGRPLVDNASKSFGETPGLPHGIIMSGREAAYGCRTQVASIDTMLSWFVDGGEYPSDLTFDLFAHDEADTHLQKFARFLKYHDAKREKLGLHPAFAIALTATPQAKGLADIYQEIVPGPTTQWLTENGYLSPFKYFRATQGKLDKLVWSGGAITHKSECEAMAGLSGDLVRDWKRFGEGRPTVGFFPRRTHAKEAMRELEAAGLEVAYVDANTPDEERWATYRALDNHSVDYLCNVNLVGRGTDIPAIACVQLCVTISSVKAFLQKVGRGSRVNPGKTDCVLIDHGGNVGSPPHGRLGFFEDERHWSLDITTKDPGEVGARPTIECPKCQAIYRGGLCRNCGYEPTPRERRAQGLQFDGSELKEVKRTEKKAGSVQTAHDLMVSALYKAGRSGRTWRQCVGIYKSECEKQGTPHRVPRTVTVGEHSYSMIRYGSDDATRRVEILYPFVHGNHGGDYLLTEAEPAGAPY